MCLRAVLAQPLDGAFEVIVVDSGDDDAADVVRREFPRVRLLTSQSRMGAAPARNWGAREARGAVLAFIDSDCVPADDWLKRLTERLEAGDCDGLGGAVVPSPGSNAVAWAGYFSEFREFLPSRANGSATHLTPNNAGYRRDVYQRAGGFPDGYFPLEDQMFYGRLREVGARILFDPALVVAHAHRRSVGPFIAHQAKIGQGDRTVSVALGRPGAGIASRRWLATLLLPLLVTYRFARTVGACWREERALLLRRPWVTGLCGLGMVGWGLGFAGYWRSSYGDGDPGHRA